MKQAVIVAAKRTPFGKYGGVSQQVEPEDLLMTLYDHFKLQHSDSLAGVDDIILGNVVGNGGNIARKSLLEAGLAHSIPGVTLDRQCGSGLEAIMHACRMIQAGAGEIYIAGGVESTSRAPWKIKRPQSVYDTKLPEFYERAAFAPEGQDPSMIQAAENVARTYHVSREAQYKYAHESHRKSLLAHQQGVMSQEIIPLTVKGAEVALDESIKPKLTLKKLSRLRSILPDGTVTVGNCCMKNDGAVMLLIMEAKTAQRYGYTTGLRFVDGRTTGVDPQLLGIGPFPAVQQLLERQQLTIEDIDAIELNEAFASQVIASQQQLHITPQQLNKYGGAIAIGHPYGASGAALVTRLFYMTAARKSIATMGIGGGMGNAILFERW